MLLPKALSRGGEVAEKVLHWRKCDARIGFPFIFFFSIYNTPLPNHPLQ